MDAKTRERLQQINRRFYAGVADDFDATRQDPWPGWPRALSHLPADAQSRLQVLDIGCGNGRFVDALIARAGAGGFDYVGVDFSPELLDHARKRYANRVDDEARGDVAFLEADVLDPDIELPERPPGFDLISLFGVLHHVPGTAERRALIARLVQRLRPAGVLVATAWQFADRPRFERRILPVADYNETADAPLDPAQLEPGDHLLRFADASLPRFCHHCDEVELSGLFRELPVHFLDAYASDGKSGDLNRYAVVARNS